VSPYANTGNPAGSPTLTGFHFPSAPLISEHERFEQLAAKLVQVQKAQKSELHEKLKKS
jgi:hypothetical protein